MPDRQEDDDGEVWGGDRRLSRPDTSLPDWEMPDGAYRPVPIVWFAGALLLQMVALFTLFVALVGQPGWVTVVSAAFVTGMLGMWTWERGIGSASPGWRIALVMVLATQLVLVAFGALAGR